MGSGKQLLAIIGLAACTWSAVIEAHHSFSAQYDVNRPATIEGMVTKFEWHNPHVYFYMDVVDEDGKVTEWELEMSNTAVMQNSGWNRTTLSVGELLKVEGALARDNSPLINVTSVTLLQTGEKIF